MREWRSGKSFQFLSFLMYTTCYAQSFPMLSCTSTISKQTIQMDSMRTSLRFPTFSRGPSLKTRMFCTARCSIKKSFFMKTNKEPLSEWFFTRRIKMLNRPNGFMLYAKLGVDFCSTPDLRHPNMKIRRGLIRTRPNFSMICDNPKVGIRIVDCSIYAQRIALNKADHRK